jgi:phospholipid/cholesterol/gamma-HCH transport system ATP-binding protein
MRNDATSPQPREAVPAIAVRGLCKAFGSKVVLDDVSFEVPRGEIVVLMGPSGTGKSVLLRCLVGLTIADRGEISVLGENISALDLHETSDRAALFQLRRRCGMLFQDGALFDDLNVGDNVGFPLKLAGNYDREQIAIAVAENLRRVGLSGVESKFPSELSGGMRKRVAFARAIALRPEIVFCDEPSSGLDPVMSAVLDELILELHASLGMTFVVISHDTAEARQIATRLGMLHEGKLVAYGPTDQVLGRPHPAVEQMFTRKASGPIHVG